MSAKCLTVLVLCQLLCFACSAQTNLAERVNELGFLLLNSIPTEFNSFYSPLSISGSLLKLLNGAEGQTEKELRTALDISDETKLDAVNSEARQVIDNFYKYNNNIDVRIANGMYIDSSLSPVNETYAKAMSDSYGSKVGVVDFQNNPRNATKVINNWVNDKTNGQIAKLYRDALERDSKLVLVNAATFSGKWKNAFNPELTSKREFISLGTDMPSLINMMNTKGEYRNLHSTQLDSHLVEIPFAGNEELSMIIIIPEDAKGLPNLFETMQYDDFNNAMKELQKQEKQNIVLSLPKFRIESEIDLKDTFDEGLELKTIFDKGSANFAKINKSPELRVTSGLHKTLLEADNEAGEVPNKTTEIDTENADNKAVIVNKPFLFVIRDRNMALNLFMGVVTSLVDDSILSLGYI